MAKFPGVTIRPKKPIFPKSASPGVIPKTPTTKQAPTGVAKYIGALSQNKKYHLG